MNDKLDTLQNKPYGMTQLFQNTLHAEPRINEPLIKEWIS